MWFSISACSFPDFTFGNGSHDISSTSGTLAASLGTTVCGASCVGSIPEAHPVSIHITPGQSRAALYILLDHTGHHPGRLGPFELIFQMAPLDGVRHFQLDALLLDLFGQ